MLRLIGLKIVLLGLLCGTVSCGGLGTVRHRDIKPLGYPAEFQIEVSRWETPKMENGDWAGVKAFFMLPREPLDNNGFIFTKKYVSTSEINNLYKDFRKAYPKFVTPGTDPKYRFSIQYLGRLVIMYRDYPGIPWFEGSLAAAAFSLKVTDAHGAVIHEKLFKFIRGTSNESWITSHGKVVSLCLAEVMAYISRGDFKTRPSGGSRRTFNLARPLEKIVRPSKLVEVTKKDIIINSKLIGLIYFTYFMGETIPNDRLSLIPYPEWVSQFVAFSARAWKWPMYPRELHVPGWLKWGEKGSLIFQDRK